MPFGENFNQADAKETNEQLQDNQVIGKGISRDLNTSQDKALFQAKQKIAKNIQKNNISEGNDYNIIDQKTFQNKDGSYKTEIILEIDGKTQEKQQEKQQEKISKTTVKNTKMKNKNDIQDAKIKQENEDTIDAKIDAAFDDSKNLTNTTLKELHVLSRADFINRIDLDDVNKETWELISGNKKALTNLIKRLKEENPSKLTHEAFIKMDVSVGRQIQVDFLDAMPRENITEDTIKRIKEHNLI